MDKKYPLCLPDDQLEKRYFELLGKLLAHGYGSWDHYIGKIDLPSKLTNVNVEMLLVEDELMERCI